MHSARLDRLITIQKKTADSPPVDEYGEPSESWADYTDVWANIKKQSGREMFAGGKVGEVDIIFRIRHASWLNEKEYRIVYDGDTYDISPPIEIGRKDGLDVPGRAQR